MPLPPGGKVRVDWQEFGGAGRDSVDISLSDVPSFVAFEHTFLRPGTYLAIVSMVDVGGRLCNQNGVVLYVYPQRTTSLELWRKRWYASTAAVQASFSGRDVTVTAV